MKSFKSLTYLFVYLFLFTALSGCVPGANKNQRVADALSQVDVYLSQGRYSDALSSLQTAHRSNFDTKMFNRWIKDNGQKVSLITDYYLSEQYQLTTKHEFVSEIAKFKSLGQNGVLPRYKLIIERINQMAAESNENGSIDWRLWDNYFTITSLQTKEQEAAIFYRSITAEAKANRPVNAISSIASFLKGKNSDPEFISMFRKKIPFYNFNKSELNSLKDIYPSMVESRMNDMILQVYVRVFPRDRVLEEDLIAMLKETSPHYKIARQTDKGKEGITVNLIKDRHDENVKPVDTQTVTVSKANINVLKATLLMPSYASYMYDLKVGGVELDYGYSLEVFKGEELLHDEFVRGHIVRIYQSCENARVVNVFGGVQPASFFANSDMEDKCTNYPKGISIDTVREAALQDTVKRLVSLEPFKSRQ